MASKVYFADMHSNGSSLLDKLKRMMKAAGFEDIDLGDNNIRKNLGLFCIAITFACKRITGDNGSGSFVTR